MQICNPGFKTHSNRSKNFNAHYIRVRKDIARRLCDEGLAKQVYMLPTGVRPDALAFNRGTPMAEALRNAADFNAAVEEYSRVNCYHQKGAKGTVSFYAWDDEPISIVRYSQGANSYAKKQARKLYIKGAKAMKKNGHSYETLPLSDLCEFYPHNNTLAIHSDAITPNDLFGAHAVAWMRRPYSERIEESPYRDQINAEIIKHPNCKLTEFCDPAF